MESPQNRIVYANSSALRNCINAGKNIGLATIPFHAFSVACCKSVAETFPSKHKVPESPLFPRVFGHLFCLLLLYSIKSAVPLAVPEKIIGLTPILVFFDRGAINHFTSSATGGVIFFIPTRCSYL